MKNIKNWSIVGKITASNLLILIGTLIIAVIGINGLDQMYTNSKSMYKNDINSVYALGKIEANLREIGSLTRKMIASHEANELNQTYKVIQQFQQDNIELIKLYNGTQSLPKEKKIFEEVISIIKKYQALQLPMLQKMLDNPMFDPDVEVTKKLEAMSSKRIDLLDQLIELNLSSAKNADASNTQVYKQGLMINVVVTVLIVLVSLTVFLILRRYFSKAMRTIMDFLQVIGTGDLTQRAQFNSEDEFGVIVQALNNTIEQIQTIVANASASAQELGAISEELSATIEKVNASMDQIHISSQEVAAGSESLSATTEEVNATVQEIMSSATKLSDKAATAQNTSEYVLEQAASAKDKAIHSIEVATSLYAEKQKAIVRAIEAGKVVEEVKKMADVISSIAAQTNLLSLNASIEAARAGEQGKGFTVVANEVRKLALQSKESVEQIQTMTSLVEEAVQNIAIQSHELLQFIDTQVISDYKSFEEISVQYKNDAKMFHEITGEMVSSMQGMKQSMEEVEQAMTNVAVFSQQSSNNVSGIRIHISETLHAFEDVAASSEHQADIAETLNETVGKFVVA